MISKKLSGGTDYLNRLTLPEGQLAVDTERKALRVYDGELQGGYEVLGTPPPSVLPGPSELIAGDLETGFYGEVGPADFISYEGLSTLVGLSAGTLHNDESLWLKFSLDGSPAYVAKRSIRHSVSWDHLNARNLVFGRTVEIGNYQYIARLMTGLVNPNTYTAGGEWNRLMYPIHVDDPNSEGWGINYTNADLNVAVGDGRISWCQETNPSSLSQRIRRGTSSITYLSAHQRGNIHIDTGWRPILISVP